MIKYDSIFRMIKTDEYESMANFIDTEVDKLYADNNRRSFFLKAAIFEAINNSYIHGSLPITMKFRLFPNKLVIRINDHGEGFPIQEKINLINEKGTQRLLEEISNAVNGRGIYMMYEFVDKVIYNKKGNQVILQINR